MAIENKGCNLSPPKFPPEALKCTNFIKFQINKQRHRGSGDGGLGDKIANCIFSLQVKYCEKQTFLEGNSKVNLVISDNWTNLLKVNCV